MHAFVGGVGDDCIALNFGGSNRDPVPALQILNPAFGQVQEA